MRFAVAAALTGTFSLVEAVDSFVGVSAGGLAIGFVVTAAVVQAKSWMSRRYGEDVGVQILVSLLIPFGAYLLADRAGCSGILAAVAAGVTMGHVEQREGVLAETRARRTAVWDTIHFGASGIVFILLGEQLPRIAGGAADVVREAGHGEVDWLLFYVAAIALGVLAVRFVWVWILVRLARRRMAQRGTPLRMPDWRLVAALTLAGVRGTVTLAGVLSLPLMLSDGSAFPARDLAVFLAAGVIIMSLLVATVLLPNLLGRLHFSPEPGEEADEGSARRAVGDSALATIARTRGTVADVPGEADLGTEARQA